MILPRVVAVLLALTVHELAHGWVALQLGDPTAKQAGRITLNPLAHLDPFGTIALFLIGFGWAKPVPVNPNNFRSPLRDNALVALAGPMSNFTCAIIFGLVLRVLIGYHGGIVVEGPVWAVMLVLTFVLIFSLGLGMFNLIPIPPLDGSHILEALLPRNARVTFNAIRPYAPIALLFIIFFVPGAFGLLIRGPMAFLFRLISGYNMFEVMSALMGAHTH